MTPKAPSLESCLTIVFTPAMGHRLCIARMTLDKSQAQMSTLLGVPQPTLSKLETGRLQFSEYLTYERFLEVFGEDATAFVLRGIGAAKFDHWVIKKRFWEGRSASGRALKRLRADLRRLSQSTKPSLIMAIMLLNYLGYWQLCKT